MCALEHAGNLQQKVFVGDGADELQSDGEPFRSEPAGDRDRGEAGEIGGAVQAEKQGAGGMLLVPELDRVLTNAGGGDGSGGANYGVDVFIFQSEMELLDELLAEFEGGKIGGCGDFGTHLKTRANVVAVIG